MSQAGILKDYVPPLPMQRKGFKDWHWIVEGSRRQAANFHLPRDGQMVLIRSIHGGVYCVICHMHVDDTWFTLYCYSPDFRMGRWELDDVLQWIEIPGFE